MAIIIDGKTHAAKIKQNVKERIAAMSAEGKRPPAFAVVLAGENPASLVYIKGKEKACAETGIHFTCHRLEEHTPQKDLLALINNLNADENVDGILVQQPFPKHIEKQTVLSAIAPNKDVDCLHPANIGLYMAGRGTFLPCTPAGIMRLLNEYNIPVEGKRCVIIGRSDVVGKPLSMLMLAQNATVTICHSYTRNLPEITRSADILVAAIGKPRFVTADMVKRGCVAIDVGVNRLEGRKVCGDFDYAACFDKAAYITPVPGGVGPMTIAMLTENCLKAREAARSSN